jgi:hypothetical protein
MTIQGSFPFIVGCSRSGTTLLRSMLDSHPQLAIPGESHFMSKMRRRQRRYVVDGHLHIERFMDDLMRDPWFTRWGISRGSVLKRLRASQVVDLADAFRVVFRQYADAQGKPLYGDKTPSYVMTMPVIAELLPEARFIHLVRDGRDVALALKEADFGPSHVADAALHWKLRVTRGLRAGEALHGRVLLVRYEDLVQDPQRVLETACAFIGLGFDESMLRFFERGDHLLKGDPQPEHHRRLAQPPRSGLRDWRRDMSADDQRMFEVLAGDALTELGYERRWRRADVAVSIRALVHRTGWLGWRLGRKVHRSASAVWKRVTAPSAVS